MVRGRRPKGIYFNIAGSKMKDGATAVAGMAGMPPRCKRDIVREGGGGEKGRRRILLGETVLDL